MDKRFSEPSSNSTNTSGPDKKEKGKPVEQSSASDNSMLDVGEEICRILERKLGKGNGIVRVIEGNVTCEYFSRKDVAMYSTYFPTPLVYTISECGLLKERRACPLSGLMSYQEAAARWFAERKR